MNNLLLLFFEFFKTGLFALGGGLATIPFLSQMGEHYGWFSAQTLADMIAISESTPGAIGVNMATYTGYHLEGILGAFVATLGLVTPSVIIINIIARFLKRFKESSYVRAAFDGIRPTVLALILVAVLGILTSSVIFVDKAIISGNILDMFNIKTSILFTLVLVGVFKFKLHPIFWITFSAFVGILFQF